MALLLSKTVNGRVGEYWKILGATTDISESKTLVRIYLFDTKAFRDNIEDKDLIKSALKHKSIWVDGIDLTREDMYTKLTESKMSEPTDETEAKELNWFADAEDC